MPLVTRELFLSATGREPEGDDLERCNCENAGRAGHLSCGWSVEHNKPQFEVGVANWNGEFPRTDKIPGA